MCYAKVMNHFINRISIEKRVEIEALKVASEILLSENLTSSAK